MQEEDTSLCAIVSQGLRAMNARLHDLVCTIGAGGQRKVWTIKTTDLLKTKKIQLWPALTAAPFDRT